MAVHSVVQADRFKEATALLNRPLWPRQASQARHLPQCGELSLQPEDAGRQDDRDHQCSQTCNQGSSFPVCCRLSVPACEAM